MPTGTVSHYNKSKGYGFIREDNNTAEIFVHFSEVEMAVINEFPVKLL